MYKKMTVSLIILSIGVGINLGLAYLIKKMCDEYEEHMEYIYEKEKLEHLPELQDDTWFMVKMDAAVNN